MIDTDTFLLAEIRRLNRNLLGLGLGVLAAGVLCGAYFQHEWLGPIQGPRPVTIEAFAGPVPRAVEAGPWFRLEATGAIPCELEEWHQSSGRNAQKQLVAVFRFVPVAGKTVAVRLDPDTESDAYLGRIVPASAGLADQLSASAQKAGLPGLEPFLFDATSEAQPQPLFALPGAILVALGFWLSARAFLRHLRPVTHPLLRPLLKPSQSPNDDWQAVSAELGAGWSMPATAGHRRPLRLRLSRDWFYHGGVLTAHLRPLANLVWAYGNDTEHRVNGVPTGTIHKLKLHFVDGSAHEFEMGQTSPRLFAWLGRLVPRKLRRPGPEARDTLFAALREAAPWALYGYSLQLAQDWGNWTARQAILAEVARRRASPPARTGATSPTAR